jgi:hypothetical protein
LKALRFSQECLGCTASLEATPMEIQVRQIEGEAIVTPVGGIVEHPHGHLSHEGSARLTLGQFVASEVPAEPLVDIPACRVDRRAQLASQITHQRAQVFLDPKATEQISQLVVLDLE